ALTFAVVVIGDDDEFAIGKSLQNFLDRIGHFSRISLGTGSALAGLMGPRQHQYAGQHVASRVSQYETDRQETIDEVRLPSPWSPPQKQEAGVREESCVLN
ncbi:MAG: hypothetical protein ACREDP_04385, partial [Bradyrhizobium sp.]